MHLSPDDVLARSQRFRKSSFVVPPFVDHRIIFSPLLPLSQSGSHFTIELAFERVMSFREFCKYGQLTYEDFVSVMRTFST
mmetsp:Transcript_17998/g.28681  ORF Transcript_17998/g.28681 Transcript_17998/m.28681 type:complete len:81 (-) Transcript_17998:425-667(-)